MPQLSDLLRDKTLAHVYKGEAESQNLLEDDFSDRALLQYLQWMYINFMRLELQQHLEKHGESKTEVVNYGPIPTDWGDWTLVAIGDKTTGFLHEAMVFGNELPEENETIPVYVCVGNHPSETFAHTQSGPRDNLHRAMQHMQQMGKGIIVYLQGESVGDGIQHELERLGKMHKWDSGAIITKSLSPSPILFDWNVVESILENLGVVPNQVTWIENSLTAETVEDSTKFDFRRPSNHSTAVMLELDLVDLIEVMKLGWLSPWTIVASMKEAQENRHQEGVTSDQDLDPNKGALYKVLGMEPLPTEFGDWTLIPVGDKTDGSIHFAMLYGEYHQGQLKGAKDVLLRVHSACHTSESYHAINCECRAELEMTMKEMKDAGGGIILYLQQEGRGNGMVGKLDQLQEMFEWQGGRIVQRLDEDGQPIDTVRAYERQHYVSERRDYAIVGEILKNLFGVAGVTMLTNNPEKVLGVKQAGIAVTRIGVHADVLNDIVSLDLRAKVRNHGHDISEQHLVVVGGDK